MPDFIFYHNKTFNSVSIVFLYLTHIYNDECKVLRGRSILRKMNHGQTHPLPDYTEQAFVPLSET